MSKVTIFDAAVTITRLHRENARMRAALEECEAYFDNRADADHDGNGFVPNEAMSLLGTVREALGKEGRP